jgi:sigma-B regulation protein RsbU (phosphoserine phosphatase)
MTETMLLPPGDLPARKFWKPWKWIGLGVYAAALLFNRWLPSPVVAAAYLYGFIAVLNVIIFGSLFLKDRFFWRVRNRLLASFIFVGVIPLLMLVGIVALSGYILLGQLAGQYLNQALQENQRLIAEINSELTGTISAAANADSFSRAARAVFARHSAKFPRMAARLLRKQPDGNFVASSAWDPKKILPEKGPHPGSKWLGNGQSFEGLVKGGENLLFTSFRPVPGAEGVYVETAAPLDLFFEERLQREKSLYISFVNNKEADISATDDGISVKIPKDSKPGARDVEAERRVNRESEARNIRRKSDPRLMVLWYLPVQCTIYETGKKDRAGNAVFRVPQVAVLKSLFGQDDEQGRVLVYAIYVLAGMFAFAEIVSLIIGLTISRRVTKSVHDIHQGILALQQGDLKHRIPVRRNDQLGLLAHSFNHMTTSVENLLQEVVEKKRLEKELEIAREVQATLFPKQLPNPPGMAVFGGCKPARTVSGDYYDFIVEDETHLDIVVGDISGKGISAALLMANLQAAMRSQILARKQDDPETVGQRLAEVMSQLNRQIFLNSPPEKYATLFLSRYDANSRTLWYCNAGHLPPVILSAREARALEVTGTVVGMFPDATYEAKSIEMPPGTLMAVFTDGITEALNGKDEEFGDRQLLDALRQAYSRTPEQIWNHVLGRVAEWQSDLPQYDDITLIITKAG